MWKKIFVITKFTPPYCKTLIQYRLTIFMGVVLFGIKIGYWIKGSKVESGTFYNMYGDKDAILVEFRFDTIDGCIKYIRENYSQLKKLNIEIKL